MAALAHAWGFPVYGWLHMDGIVLKLDPAAPERVMQLLQQEDKQHPFAAAFTLYDVLAFYKTQVRCTCTCIGQLLVHFCSCCPVLLCLLRGVLLGTLADGEGCRWPPAHHKSAPVSDASLLPMREANSGFFRL